MQLSYADYLFYMLINKAHLVYDAGACEKYPISL